MDCFVATEKVWNIFEDGFWSVRPCRRYTCRPCTQIIIVYCVARWWGGGELYKESKKKERQSRTYLPRHPLSFGLAVCSNGFELWWCCTTIIWINLHLFWYDIFMLCQYSIKWLSTSFTPKFLDVGGCPSVKCLVIIIITIVFLYNFYNKIADDRSNSDRIKVTYLYDIYIYMNVSRVYVYVYKIWRIPCIGIRFTVVRLSVRHNAFTSFKRVIII